MTARLDVEAGSLRYHSRAGRSARPVASRREGHEVDDAPSRARSDRAHLPWWKLVAIWLVFLGLHFSYETFPNVVFRIIGEDGETTFFHMKMLFFAYIFVAAAQSAAMRIQGVHPTLDLVISRMLIAVAYPWLTITMWFSAEALGLDLPVVPWEIIYANVWTLIGIYLALRLEEALGGLTFRPALKWATALVFAAALVSYVSFSIDTPVDFFTTPPGW